MRETIINELMYNVLKGIRAVLKNHSTLFRLMGERLSTIEKRLKPWN